MKVCFYGLGSIGIRHLKNLWQIASEDGFVLDVHAFRHFTIELPEEVRYLVNKSISDEAELDSDYDAAFITNPTSLHYKAMCTLLSRARCIFIEKPIFESCNIDYCRMASIMYNKHYVGAPLRYTGVFSEMKRQALESRVFAVRSICSSYLPEWRPNVDYRNVYSAHKSKGGGVALDLIHEWDYLTELFGFPESVNSIQGRYSHLDISSDDIAVYIARYPQMVLELHLDYFGKVATRQIEMITSSGKIVGDFLKNTVISEGDSNFFISFTETPNDKYLREMREFLDVVFDRKSSSSSVLKAYRVLQLAVGG